MAGRKLKRKITDNGPRMQQTTRAPKKPHQFVPSGGPRITRSITASITARAPAQAVFNTTELLEGILVQLPIQSIITCQSVCRRFQDVIQTSVMIQQKLFLRSNNKGSNIREHDGEDSDGGEGTNWQFPGTKSEVFLNPLLTRLTPNPRRQNSFIEYLLFLSGSGGDVVQAGNHLKTALLHVLEGRVVPPTLSNMHLTDATTTRVTARLEWEMEGRHKVTTVKMDAPEGCTVGMALKAIRKRVPKRQGQEEWHKNTLRLSTGKVVSRFQAKAKRLGNWEDVMDIESLKLQFTLHGLHGVVEEGSSAVRDAREENGAGASVAVENE